MSFFTGIIVYLMIFWVTLFTVLPWGNRAAENPEVGHAGSAPENPRIGKKFLITALLSTILWGIVYALVEAEIIDFYSIGAGMLEEDQVK